MSVPLNYKGAEAFIVMQYERAENKSEIIYSMLGSSLNAVWYVSCCTPTATTLPWQQTTQIKQQPSGLIKGNKVIGIYDISSSKWHKHAVSCAVNIHSVFFVMLGYSRQHTCQILQHCHKYHVKCNSH